MICERVMHFRDIHFFHMAGNAILSALRARVAGMARGLFLIGCDVTTGTDGVVSGVIRLQRLVRIMASNAGQPSVALRPAFALFQTIRLGPGCRNAFDSGKFHIPPSVMACAAEVDGVRRIEPGRIENGAG